MSYSKIEEITTDMKTGPSMMYYRIFMLDEPKNSLDISWQYELINTLVKSISMNF